MQLQLDTRPLEARRPRDLMADALKWAEDNRFAWGRLVRWAHEDAKEVGSVRVKSYIEALRMLDGVKAVPGPIKLPNAYSAPFGRILAAWYPDLEPHIPLTRSKCDGCVIPPCPEWARA